MNSPWPKRYAHPRDYTIRVRCVTPDGRVIFDANERTLPDAYDRRDRLARAYPEANITIGAER